MYKQYVESRILQSRDYPFYSLIFAIMKKSSAAGSEIIQREWPTITRLRRPYDWEFYKKLLQEEWAKDLTTLIMTAVRQADTANAAVLRRLFPEIYDELQARYLSPGGTLPGEVAAK